jgi:vitamin B12/bleomycin/antimicrobial peptide transport system ATP-binding/permease protein
MASSTQNQNPEQLASDQERIRLDRLTWERWRTAVSSFAGSSDAGVRAKALFAALFGLLLAINGLNVVNSYVGRDFMTAIEQRSMSRFVAMAAMYVGVFAVSTVAAVVYRFTEERLALLWRDWLTRRLMGRYLQDGTYYWLREQSDIANADQRIADDVRAFATTTLSLTLVLLNTTFTIVAFAGVMWSISPLLFGAAVAYAALGSGLTVLFGRPLIWLNYNQADREASLRADLIHLRENAESVAVLRREGRIGARLMRRVDDLVANTKRIIAVNRNLGFFTTGYNYLIQIIPALIVAPLFIRGEAEFGVISQSSMAFSHLLGAFSLIVVQFQQISGYAVVLARLSALGESIEQATARSAGGIDLDDSGSQLEWQGLSLRSRRDDGALLQSLTLAIAPGTRVLVNGPNEAARVSLFRASAGLWKAGTGRIVRPSPGQILFVQERPYLPPGTLRDAVLRTAHEQDVDDARIGAALRAVGVEEVVDRAGGLGVERDWDDALSLADQQRISFARVLLAAPRFAVLEGPGTLLGAEAAARFLEELRTRSITAVTFASDDALAAHHDIRLVLETDGTWGMQPIRTESKTM